MQLSKVVISNYRSIKDAEVGFSPSFRILIGKNEVGKTNILSACSLIDPLAKVVPADLREAWHGEEPVSSGYVRFIFRVSAEEITELSSRISRIVIGPRNKAVFERNGRKYLPAEVAQLFAEWLHDVAIPSGQRSNRYWAVSGGKVLDGWLSPSNGIEEVNVEVGGRSVDLAKFPIVSLEHVPAERASDFQKLSVDALMGAVHKELSGLLAPKIPACLFWRYSEESLLPSSIDVSEFESNPASCEPLRAMFLLAKEADPGAAIAKAKQRPNGLKNLLVRVSTAATEHVQQRWKELKGVNFVLAPNGDAIDAAVKDEFNEYSFSRRSDGFKRFVSFLLLISARYSAPDLGQVLFIQDEPDLGLHPTGVRSLLSELLKLSSENYVIVSTHSIFLVDKDRIDRHLVVTKSREETSISNAGRSEIQDEEVLMNALGYSLYDQVKPINIIFEGWRDKRLFSAFAGKKRPSAARASKALKGRIGLVHAMGVKDVVKVASYFEAIERNVLIVTDGDEVAVQRQREAENAKKNVRWLRYDQLLGHKFAFTAEDFIEFSVLKRTFDRVASSNGLEVDFRQGLLEGAAVGVVSVVEGLLPLDKDKKKQFLNDWKSEIFDNIQPGDVSSRYDEVAAAILDEVDKL